MRLTDSGDAVKNYRLVNNLWGTMSEGDLRWQVKLTSPIVRHVIYPSPAPRQPIHVTEAWGPRKPYKALFYHPSDHTFAREPQKTDPLNQDYTYSPTYHLQNSHDRGYETSVMSSYDKHLADQNHHRKHHFVKGTVPGGSTSNKMIYGMNELANNETPRKQRHSEKPLSFMYGTEAATNVGKPVPSRKPNNALMLETRTEIDHARNQKLAFDQDEFMEKHIREKRLQKYLEQEEKKKDFEMLTNFNPWGKQGAGAPRFAGTQDKPDAKITKAVSELREEKYHPMGAGAGGGAVNRTTSGRPQATYQADPELRFQKYGQQKYVEPNLRYKKDSRYGKELDSFLEEARSRKELQRQESFEKELRHISQDPFSKPGAGAPMKDSRGNLQAAFPTTLSKDIQELRQVGARHPHAYNDNAYGQKQAKEIEQEYGPYDPWGRGYGAPVRDERGRVVRQNPNAGRHDDLDGLGIPIGKPGAGAPMKHADGRLKARKAQTLTKTAAGQNLQRDFSPKGRECYDPFSKPGAGAPIRDTEGSVKTHIMGRVEKDAITMNEPSPRNAVASQQEYLRTLRAMTDQAHEQRKAEQLDLKTGGADVAAWMRSGVVGQPRYDPLTKEIVASRKHTSDITQQKLNIRPQKNEHSRDYHHDLETLANEREEQKRRDKDLQQKSSREHVDTMNTFWGRAGAGAPLTKGDVYFARKQKVGIAPADGGGFRD